MKDAALTVTEFVRTVDEALAAFDGINVEGEVDDFKIIHGKWVTFQLKDKHSAIGCFLTVWQYRTQIEDGMLVQVKGRPRLREKGFFSLVVEQIVPAGEGALKRAFELLKKKLSSEGLFDDNRKRPLPRFPQHIALITSREAAAYSDFLKVLQARQGGLNVSFINSHVQGKEAVEQIVEALQYANTQLQQVEAVVLVRGGGSLEDLQAFNDELVARAVAASRVPTIVGVGHERDVTLAELAADVRASTPSNAAELLVRSREEVMLEILQMRGQLSNKLLDQITHNKVAVREKVDTLHDQVRSAAQAVQTRVAGLIGIRQRFAHTSQVRREGVQQMRRQLRQTLRVRLTNAQGDVTQLGRLLQSLSPERILQRGYSITRISNGTIVKDARQVAIGDAVKTQLARGSLDVIVNKVSKS